MEYYPEDLLVGAFPLVFAVNAIHDEVSSDSAAASQQRSLFDRFLDALAASLNDRETESPQQPTRSHLNTFFSDDRDDSSDDELFDRSRRSVSISAGLALGRLSLTRVISTGGTESTSYDQAEKAKSMQESFFDRARIQTISLKHGFPPSKDPYGTNNVAHAIGNALQSKSVLKLHAAFNKFPIDGILSAGWLEKHVHAQPSVIMVVCTVCGNQKKQDAQDEFLFKSIENLQESLVAKRQCKIQIIGLMADDVTMLQGETWQRTLSMQMSEGDSVPTNAESPFNISLLQTSLDLESTDTGIPTSPALHSLQGQLRQASLAYYSSQILRVKNKIRLLNEDQRQRRDNDDPPIVALPLFVRYYWQIGLFYEFQLKHRRSLQYWNEAYRHLARYYHYLIKRVQHGSVVIPVSPSKSSDISHSVTAEAGEDSVEVAFQDDNEAKFIWKQIPITYPPDMLHQCRAVAEWIHVKLLLAGLATHNDQGRQVAATQIRLHNRIMASRQARVSNLLPSWYDLQYVTRQKFVLGQLLERHPVSYKSEQDISILTFCSTWRTFASAVELILRLAREIKHSKSISIASGLNEKNDTMRARYLGCLDQEDMQVAYRKESSIDHIHTAAETIKRAITLFEKEQDEQKKGFYAEEEYTERVTSRTGARLYYLAGGVLLTLKRHEEAFGYLEKASKLSKGWRELELSIRRMLIECYEKHIPTSRYDESSQTLASMILDSYFNAAMSSKDLRRALQHFASVSGGDSLQWYHSTEDEDGEDLPISFHVTFPEAVFATVGDVVKASVRVKSNLDYAVHVNSVVLKSFAGELNIALNDLMAAKNANEGIEGKGIIIQRKSEIQITTNVELPKLLSVIGTDDSGNGGATQATAGKGSFAKNARPRTANVTSAGGARLVSEDTNAKGNSVSQGWSLRFLGGKPLRYDGMSLFFYPVQVEKTTGDSESITLIELIVEKKKPKTHANIKRTPFEEENYIASAWARPQRLPFSEGPRSIRVLGPQPQMVVSNLSESITDGKALEGTVNRVLLKLESGPAEKCTNVKVQISHFSVLILSSGTTLRLVPGEEISAESEGCANMNDSRYRCPTLVSQNSVESRSKKNIHGYDLPSSWEQTNTNDRREVASLNGGEATYICCDLYRPTLDNRLDAVDENSTPLSAVDGSTCKTDIYVTVSYQQERPVSAKQKRGRKSLRRKPLNKSADGGDDAGKDIATSTPETDIDNDNESEVVSLEYSCSIVWCSPLSTYFHITQRADPSGKRHVSNNADIKDEQNASGIEAETSLINRETITSRCSIAATHLISNLQIELQTIKFVGLDDKDSVRLLLRNSGLDSSNVLYQSTKADLSRFLSQGSSFSAVYSVQADIDEHFDGQEATCKLGSVVVEWKPSVTALPDEARQSIEAQSGVTGHGPLALDEPSTIGFNAPICSIEKSPFNVTMVPTTLKPRVSEPFQVEFKITNNTAVYQSLALNVVTDPLSGSNKVIFAGPLNDNWQLEPFGKRRATFTLISPRAGPVSLPEMTITSSRFKSWVVRDASTSMQGLYVFP